MLSVSESEEFSLAVVFALCTVLILPSAYKYLSFLDSYSENDLLDHIQNISPY